MAAVNTNVIALGVQLKKDGTVLPANTGMSTLNFGFSELNANFSQLQKIRLRNKGSSPATFNIAQDERRRLVALDRPSLSASVTIPGGAEALVDVTLNVPVATVGASNGAGLSFREVAGLITLTPTGGSNNGVTLRVPVLPRAEGALRRQRHDGEVGDNGARQRRTQTCRTRADRSQAMRISTRGV